MKYCYECGCTTAGEPLFCNYCGRSYNVKLCPKLHVNPRFAEACSQCGSRDLSTPQPKVPVRWRIFAFVGQFLSAPVLILFSYRCFLGIAADIKSHSQLHERDLILASLLIFFWTLWTMLPDSFRRLIHRSTSRRNKRRN